MELNNKAKSDEVVVWKYIGSIMMAVFGTAIAMWITLGANASTKGDLQVLRAELQVTKAELQVAIAQTRSEIVVSDAKYDQRLSEISDIVNRNVRVVNQLTGYITARDKIPLSALGEEH